MYLCTCVIGVSIFASLYNFSIGFWNCSECVVNEVFNLIMYTRFQHDFYITRCSCRLTVSRRVPLVKQVLPTFPENLTSLVFNEVHVAESSVFCVAFYGVFFVLLSVLFLDIVIVCLSINNL